MQYADQGAIISKDTRHRMLLWREWEMPMGVAYPERKIIASIGNGRKRVAMTSPRSMVFVMLNPSTADGDIDDPTIRKCVKFAKREGFARMEVVNLFSWRATEPSVILGMHDYPKVTGNEKSALMESNDEIIRNALIERKPGRIICAWGNHGGHLDRAAWFLRSFAGVPLHCFALTKMNHPKHPLYVRDDASLMPFNMAAGHQPAGRIKV